MAEAATKAPATAGLAEAVGEEPARTAFRQEPPEPPQPVVPKAVDDYTLEERVALLEHVVANALGVELTAARAELGAKNPASPNAPQKAKAKAKAKPKSKAKAKK